MHELYNQLALLDALLSNWDAIRMRMGIVTPALDGELAQVAARLSAAESPEEFALILDDLLDLTMDTPAHDYLRDLIARSSLGLGGASVRGAVGEAVSDLVSQAAIQESNRETGKALGRMLVAQTTTVTVPVFFATNRTTKLAGELSKDLTFGQAQVTIPVAVHKTGNLETPRWWNPFPAQNPERYVVCDTPEILDQEAFSTRLAKAFEEGPASDLLIFLHGYNVTFEDAARRAAQVAYDLDFHGTVVLFSWPSMGHLRSYFADEEHAAASAEPLAQFLQFLEGGPWKKVHLIAHSMGNRVMILGLADNRRLNLPLGQIIFVAADVYVDLFEQKFGKITGGSSLLTSYASKADKALWFSSRFHQTTRIGYFNTEPTEVEGLETIDATYVDTSLLGHSYYGDERSVLTDIGFLIREGLPAGRRGLHPSANKKYWIFPR